MSSYYSGSRAHSYNRRWRNFTTKTLAEVIAMIDFQALSQVQEQQGRTAKVLDVACGTGLLLQRILERVPGAEAFGVDASADMLAQAQAVLRGQPDVWLEQRKISGDEFADLPFTAASFDLITCTNALHDMPKPTAVLAGLGQLLAPGGQLVIEDYARRQPSFPWIVVEWLANYFENGHVRAYTLAEARLLCTQAGLPIACEKTFVVNWLWHGWALRTAAAMPSATSQQA